MAGFDKGAAQVGICRSHDTSTKGPSEECGQDCPPPLVKRKTTILDAPYHNESRLYSPHMSAMPRRATVKVDTDSGCV